MRIALRFGADLVPTYTFHNVDTFHLSRTCLAGPRKWLQVPRPWPPAFHISCILPNLNEIEVGRPFAQLGGLVTVVRGCW